MVASVVSVVSVVIECRSSSAFAFLSLIDMRNLTSSLLELGTCGSLAGRTLFGWKEVMDGVDWVNFDDGDGPAEDVKVVGCAGAGESSGRRLRMTVFVVPLVSFPLDSFEAL